MRTERWNGCAAAAACVILGAAGVNSASAAITVPGADGSDGVFVFVPDAPNGNTMTIDLSQATDRQWDQPSPVPGKGVYDPNKWAVIFKYTAVAVPSGKTVTFKNHRSRAPVVWLVSGAVAVDGVINLDGGTAAYPLIPEPGPGGFRGGRPAVGPTLQSGGHGPGGGSSTASYATVAAAGAPSYGNARILPLIGGSGGAGHPSSGCPGTAAGGAILIAAGQSISINGAIYARGGSSGCSYSGSGGAIRLIADAVTGTTGQLIATGASSNHGRIRLEANTVTLNDLGSPAYTIGTPGAAPDIWPPAGSPTVRVTSVGGKAISGDPAAELTFPSADVSLTNPNPVAIQMQCTNVPSNATVKLRVIPRSGQDITYQAVFLSGSTASSTWQVQAPLVGGFSTLQARAVLP